MLYVKKGFHLDKFDKSFSFFFFHYFNLYILYLFFVIFLTNWFLLTKNLVMNCLKNIKDDL